MDHTAQKASNQSFNQIALSMFRIGVLLLELGTGNIVCGHRPGKINKLRDSEFFMCKPGTGNAEPGQWKSLATIVDILNTTMGNDYASATSFCLDKMRDRCGDAAVEPSKKDIQSAYKRIFDDYLVNIYIPLDKLSCKAAWVDRHQEDVDSMWA